MTMPRVTLEELYGVDPERLAAQDARRAMGARHFRSTYGRDPEAVFSAPGRIELLGNHTDHQGGQVLATTIGWDVLAFAAANEEKVVRLHSNAYRDAFTLWLDDLAPLPEERGRVAALIRGVAAGLAARGCGIGGLDLFFASQVPIGGGLSSSAAIEVLLGRLFHELHGSGDLSCGELARVAQDAETNWFGKPCGLMDQLVISHGGLIALDFANPDEPGVSLLDVAFPPPDKCMILVQTGSDHEGLDAAYASIPQEMGALARALGRRRMRDVSQPELLQAMPKLRQTLGDRAVLRGLHFLDEQERVVRGTAALKRGDWETFLSCTRESGVSSHAWLQSSFLDPESQGISLALYLCRSFFEAGTAGGWRVHGGGFGGSVLALMESDRVEPFRRLMEPVFGKGAVREVQIRRHGVVRLNG
ncbi:GHMP kinases N terminal domain-containing protein [Sulfidibacter corallicola]|uniref:Galactokinase n=1 Tax=Sulfidibacter corallicola TaxID=2818388 RepID=A0A8A4TCC4_SULCO|nr:galactokinase family protein [Sulfidibacter corallicola]QTD47586.1 hypothetical protein J3U87_18495 [Sulfidibacter corallicola]